MGEKIGGLDELETNEKAAGFEGKKVGYWQVVWCSEDVRPPSEEHKTSSF